MVEDDGTIRDAITIALEAEGHTVNAAGDGSSIDDLVNGFMPDLAVIDLRLPSGPDGVTLARHLHSTAIPVIVVTATEGEQARLDAFSAGAADLVAKPFSVPELMARVRSVLSRVGGPRRHVLVGADVAVDTAQHRVSRGGSILALTPTEFRLLAAFVEHPGSVLTRRQLSELVWEGGDRDHGTIESHVSSLRAKLEGYGPRLVHTVRDEGYLFGS